MQVTLTPEMEELVMEKMASGQYRSTGDIVLAGLRLLAGSDSDREERLEFLLREVTAGIDQADCGETSPLDIRSIQQEGRAILEQRRKAV